jgi:hypothetical protein
MTSNVPYGTTAGYGSPSVNSDGAALVDTQDGIPAVVPQLNPATGQKTAAAVTSIANPDTAVPELNAILVELRVIAYLLYQINGDNQLDLEQMRSDELFNSLPATGVV